MESMESILEHLSKNEINIYTHLDEFVSYILGHIQNASLSSGSLKVYLAASESKYDREKYNELLFDAAETILGIFGFDKTLYGKPKDKWWLELKRKRMRDVGAEQTSSEIVLRDK
jgi:hypothetical protein